jgi:hypothetical protein
MTYLGQKIDFLNREVSFGQSCLPKEIPVSFHCSIKQIFKHQLKDKRIKFGSHTSHILPVRLMIYNNILTQNKQEAMTCPLKVRLFYALFSALEV